MVFLRSELAQREDLYEMIGQSAEMRRLQGLVVQVARTTATVLITGRAAPARSSSPAPFTGRGPDGTGPSWR